MVDVLGKELNVGDKVAYVSTHYHTMKIGYVVKLTPKGCQVNPRKDAECGVWKAIDQVVRL